MPPLIFALISYLGWGIGDIFITKANRMIGGFNTSFYFQLFGFVLGSLFVPFAIADINKFTPLMVILCIVLSLLNTLPSIAFNKALEIGNAAVVVTITSSFSAVAVLLSVIFLQESLSFYQAIFIVVIFSGIILTSLDLNKFKNKQPLLNKGLGLALLAMVLWGIIFTFLKIPVKQVGWFWPGYIFYMGFPLIALFMKFGKIKLVRLNKASSISLLLATIFILVGGFAYNIGISKGLVAIIAPIASSASTLTTILAFLIFKDPITKQQIAGIITTLSGIVLLSVFSV